MKQTCNRGGPSRGAGRRKKDQRKRAAQALAAGAVIAGGTQAYAVPIRFDNPPGPAHFDWARSFGDDTNWMDFTVAADAQPGVTDGPTSLKLHEDANNSRVGRFDQPIDMQITGYYLEPIGAGQLIPSGFSWLNQGFGYYYGPALLPEGDSYFGIRFDLGGGYQYGWIGVIRTGSHLDAFAWGYETDPGVPIAAGAGGGGEPIPTVSEYGLIGMGLAALALGVWVIGKKRKPGEPEPA